MPTITLPLDEMTVEEKLQLVETIWANIAEHHDDMPSPLGTRTCCASVNGRWIPEKLSSFR